MKQWREYSRELALGEMLRLEGRGTHAGAPCGECSEPHPLYRCTDCFGHELFCQRCILPTHRRNPLHTIEVSDSLALISPLSITEDCTFQRWNNNFFERISLKSLGFRIQLGHRPGITCVNPKPSSNDDFVIIDCNGIHEVELDYCSCEGAKSAEVQLLRSALYPVTSMNPKSAATFRVMKLFHILSFESKCSGYEFYNTLSRYTDNVGVNPARVSLLFDEDCLFTDLTQDRYDEFMRIVRQWRNLKLLKRGGRGHEDGGILGTKPGELALLCPACPHPGINLPPDWDLAPAAKLRGVYDSVYFLALTLGGFQVPILISLSVGDRIKKQLS